MINPTGMDIARAGINTALRNITLAAEAKLHRFGTWQQEPFRDGMAKTLNFNQEESPMSITRLISTRLTQAGSLAVTIMIVLGAVSFANDQHTSSRFEGPKANIGTVTHSKQGEMNVLSLSSDFVVPDTPAPHWQVVDSKGNAYLLQRLKVKGDKYNQTITVPAYVKDVAKVQIWCAFAETLLGEAKFPTPVK